MTVTITTDTVKASQNIKKKPLTKKRKLTPRHGERGSTQNRAVNSVLGQAARRSCWRLDKRMNVALAGHA